ncbi:tetratricopeptide repeat protein [Egbenema bharatensis]|uniref:tetratricopeptide repeat protein n=1 Tax=Egbenema bharatensis TaxID=3463334 RepID=UPI003A89BB67
MAVLAFVGLSVAPLIGAFQGTPQIANSPTASTDDRLETEARGYEAVLQREPDNESALRGLLAVRIEQGNIPALIPVLERLAADNPEQPDYAVLLGQVKEQVGDLEGAAQAYRGVLETRPGDVNALKGLSALLLQQERPQAAIGLLEDTLQTSNEANQIQPGSVDVASVRVLLGEVYFKQEQYEEAIATFDRAIEGSPEDFRPILGKALVLQAQGRNDEAAPLFASAEALAPDQYKDQIQQAAAGATTTTQTDTPAPAVDETIEPASEGNSSNVESDSPAEAE